jgi:2-keto-3-deoxy-L-rhamnonate aldolase RhmA
MRENRLRTLWRDDRAAINGWLAIPDGFAAETMAHQGWDTLTIDQHGGRLPGDGACRAISLRRRCPSCALARARHRDETLDAGATA